MPRLKVQEQELVERHGNGWIVKGKRRAKNPHVYPTKREAVGAALKRLNASSRLIARPDIIVERTRPVTWKGISPTPRVKRLRTGVKPEKPLKERRFASFGVFKDDLQSAETKQYLREKLGADR